MNSPELHVDRGFRPVLRKLLNSEDEEFVDAWAIPDTSFPVPLPSASYKGAGWVATRSSTRLELPAIMVARNGTGPVMRQAEIFYVGLAPEPETKNLLIDKKHDGLGNLIRDAAEHGPMTFPEAMYLLGEFAPVESLQTASALPSIVSGIKRVLAKVF